MTVDLNRLREARHFAGSFVDSSHEAVTEILEAVLNAPTVWWCLKHSASGDEARGVCWPGAVFSGSSPCRMVRASVVIVEGKCGCTVAHMLDDTTPTGEMVPDPECNDCGGDGMWLAWPDDPSTEPYPCPSCGVVGSADAPNHIATVAGHTITLRDHSKPCEHVERMRDRYEAAFGHIPEEFLLDCPWSGSCPGGLLVNMTGEPE